jgi:hypothetical protein
MRLRSKALHITSVVASTIYSLVINCDDLAVLASMILLNFPCAGQQRGLLLSIYQFFMPCFDTPLESASQMPPRTLSATFMGDDMLAITVSIDCKQEKR